MLERVEHIDFLLTDSEILKSRAFREPRPQFSNCPSCGRRHLVDSVGRGGLANVHLASFGRDALGFVHCHFEGMGLEKCHGRLSSIDGAHGQARALTTPKGLLWRLERNKHTFEPLYAPDTSW